MKNLNRIIITALSIVLIITAMPFAASAEANTLGTESPYIKAVFTDSNGDEADGNSLEVGRYTVNLELSGISSVAVFNFAADITDDISIQSVSSIAEIENSGFEYGGYKVDTDNNKFVIVISTVSKTESTAVTDGTVFVTLTVDVNTAGDFEDFFAASTNRDDTFIIADFRDGNESAYVYKTLEQTDTDFPFLDFDMSPDNSGYTVTGTVKVAKDEHGDSYAETSFVQNATINAIDQSGETVATTTTANDGTFSLEVPNTAVSLKVVKYCVIERTITLSGNAVADYPAIPVVAIDYNNSGGYDATDKGLFKSKYEADDADADLNGSGGADASDKGIFKLFNKDMDYTYSDFTL
ncbi:MAG: hypothetical protein IJS03_01700 [Eubacterium sp.]|nr:hypothetical protein [Eubacterium sp.]